MFDHISSLYGPQTSAILHNYMNDPSMKAALNNIYRTFRTTHIYKLTLKNLLTVFGNYLSGSWSLCSLCFQLCQCALQPQQPVLWAPSPDAAAGDVKSVGAVNHFLFPPCFKLEQRGRAVLPASCFKDWVIIHSTINQGRDVSVGGLNESWY